MTEDKEKKLERLYDIAKNSAGLPEPKRSLFGAKCPKCGNKLNKESAKEVIFSGEGGTELAKTLTSGAGLPDGVYNAAVDHFTCSKCGYNYAKAKIEPLQEDVG